MAYSPIDNCNLKNVPYYFYRVKEDESLEHIADKMGVAINQLAWEQPGAQPQPGDIVVVNLG